VLQETRVVLLSDLQLRLRNALDEQGCIAVWKRTEGALMVMPHQSLEPVWNLVTFTDPSTLQGVTRSFGGSPQPGMSIDQLRERLAVQLDRSWDATLAAIRELAGGPIEPGRN